MLDRFRRDFGQTPRLFRAPGRINIIGEHTDYNDGLVLPVNADLHTWVAIAPRHDRRIRMRSLNFDEAAELSLDSLLAQASGDWQVYAAGVLQVLQDEGFDLPGADILIAGDIPIRSGLSSSASFETAIAYAILSCAGQPIDRNQIARLCQRAENEIVRMACGIMDQFVISVCESGSAMMLDCRSLEYRLAPIPADARLLVVDSGVHRQLTEGGYNARRRECESAVEVLSGRRGEPCTLRDIDLHELETGRRELGERLYRRARHVVTENRRVEQAFESMAAGDLAALGRAMSQSHLSLRDDFEVSCGEVDALVDIAVKCDGVYGSRMTGGGFGGCTVTLVAADHVEQVIAEINREYGRLIGEPPWSHVLGITPPVTEVDAA